MHSPPSMTSSTELYRRLDDEVDYPINYHLTGSIRLAHRKERMQEFEHSVSMGQHQGIDFKMIPNNDMKEGYPFLKTHDLVGRCWDPIDGDIDPAQLTQALAKGARSMGAKIACFCPGAQYYVTLARCVMRALSFILNLGAGAACNLIRNQFKPQRGSRSQRSLRFSSALHRCVQLEVCPFRVSQMLGLPKSRKPCPRTSYATCADFWIACTSGNFRRR